MVRKGGNGSWGLYDINTNPEVILTDGNIGTYFPEETRTVAEIIAELQTMRAIVLVETPLGLFQMQKHRESNSRSRLCRYSNKL